NFALRCRAKVHLLASNTRVEKKGREMDIDIYQQCPCHSDKKIKFCCGKDIMGDLNQILAKNASGQGLAALEQLERTIAKWGPKDCLLTIQTHILIVNGEIEKARQSNELFVKNNPGHSTGFHHQALIHLADGNMRQAVESLQDAMDSITGSEIPLSLANAFRMIGLGLLSSGHLVGARAHLQFAYALKGGKDDELNRMIYETFRMPGTSILLKGEFRLPPVNEDVPWAKKYANANRAMDRGQFRKSLKFLKNIDQEFPDQLAIVQGIATLHLFLGNIEEIPPAWRRLSLLPEISDIAAVEAEGMAQLFDKATDSDKMDVIRVSYELSDGDKANEIASACSRLTPLAAIGEDPFQEGPPPRSGFYVLDKDKLNSADDVNLDSLPNVSGELLFYGKQTDRPARMEWVSAKNDEFVQEQQYLEMTFATVVQGTPKQQKVAEASALQAVVAWNWHLPDSVTREMHSTLVKQKRTEVLKNGWANFEFACLDNQTPRQAANDPKYRIPLLALLMNIEQSVDGQYHDDLAIKEMRDELGIDGLELIDPTGLGQFKLSPVQQQYLEFKNLTSNQLVDIQTEAVSIGNVVVLKRTVPEVLKRTEIKQIPRDVSFSMMAQLTDDETESLDYLAQARSEAVKADRPIGTYLVQEFEFRLSRGLTEKLPVLLDTIKRNHLDEPEVEYHLVRVLRKYNLMEGGPEDAGPTAPEDSAAVSPTWTPDGNSGEAGEDPESDKPSQLWLPD
ncbi:hypothetical protein N9231_06250, partial [Saprospiraceae bacterium]|nr:hypothetical protein [Saprospiraceae bacterium]